MNKRVVMCFFLVLLLSGLCYAENESENVSEEEGVMEKVGRTVSDTSDVIGTWDIYAELTKGNMLYFLIIVLGAFFVFLKVVDLASSVMMKILAVVLVVLIVIAILRYIL